MMTGLLEGKVAVITGASRGIGEAIAIRYAMEGASVVVSARTQNDGDHPLAGGINSVAKRINDSGGTAAAIRCDLAIEAHRTNLILETEKLFGPVDILVNNAAITYFLSVEKFKLNRFDIMFEVQVKAPFHLSQLILPSMKSRKTGRILNISSHAALHPPKDAAGRGSAVYGMCKASLERFTTGLASEVYDDNIGVNVISPGLVATPGVVHHNLITDDTPDDAVTPVEDMAEACLRLVHGSAKDITGMITYADEMIASYDLIPQDLVC
ncbi:MAG: citronellol/citronellal dehydrogenase [Candidatus Azotimanducaceae bacterium]|jgi:citronellol/citronellal dehydrogenase